MTRWLTLLCLGGCFVDGSAYDEREASLLEGPCGDDEPLQGFVDGDDDGFGDLDQPTAYCAGDGLVVSNANDCNDGSPLAHPGRSEVPYDGLDNDCDPLTPDDDLDDDGLVRGVDCDDDDATVLDSTYRDDDGDGYGTTVQAGCDGAPRDGDCDDDDDAVTYLSYVDGDGDGIGGMLAVGCTGAVFVDGDCDDGDAAILPGATDWAGDGIDQDCDGTDAVCGDRLVPAKGSINTALSISQANGCISETLHLEGGVVDLDGQPLVFAESVLLPLGADVTLTALVPTVRPVIEGMVTLFDGAIEHLSLRDGGSDHCVFIPDGATGVRISSVNVEGCSTPTSGGGLYVEAGSAGLVVEDSTFQSNGTGTSGGGAAAFVAGADVTFSRTSFVGNSAFGSGGAIVTEDATGLLIEDCVFEGNSSALGVGGAVYQSGGDLTVVGSRFEGNTTNSHGGALGAFAYGALTVASTTFDDNSAGDNGGGIYLVGGKALAETTLTDLTLTANEAGAGREGEAIYMEGVGVVTASRIVLQAHGGAHAWHASGSNWQLDLDDIVSVDNHHGLYLGSAGPIDLAHALLSGHSGTGATLEGPTVTLQSVTAHDNQGSISLLATDEATLSSGLLVGNAVGLCDPTGTAQLTDSIEWGTTAACVTPIASGGDVLTDVDPLYDPTIQRPTAPDAVGYGYDGAYPQ